MPVGDKGVMVVIRPPWVMLLTMSARFGGDQAQRAAGVDRGQLPVVAEQPDDRAPLRGVGGETVKSERIGHPGLGDHDHVAGAEPEHAPGGGD
jgi:hypothetical protein